MDMIINCILHENILAVQCIFLNFTLGKQVINYISNVIKVMIKTRLENWILSILSSAI